MSLTSLLVFAVIIYALRAKGDVTLNGKAGWFSIFFQAKDRRSKEREGPSSLLRPRKPPADRN